MKFFIKWFSPVVLSLFLFSCGKEPVVIILKDGASEREIFGAKKLEKMLSENNYSVTTQTSNHYQTEIPAIYIRIMSDSLLTKVAGNHGISFDDNIHKEGFQIINSGNKLFIAGKDETGALYGCLKLIDILKEKGSLPGKADIKDQPEMVMRGTCIGLQKTEYLPGRNVYEYPYTPENFPWFYDKEHWIRYLDMLLENRMNSLYLWNGHPFASLVKLDDYPYAVEVDEETFQKNKEVFAFLTEEANKRGIYVIQMFYNIIVSKPFAEHYNIRTQERSRPITPLISDYTRKSIAAFIEEYPNVGLMVCLGEAMNTIEDDVEWFTKVIIPGVRDGLAALGRTDEPPIILRGHDTDAKRVMEAALPIYTNLYTTHKYNGESLTTYEPRSSWAEIHQGLSRLGSVHISNVHILANLEPFRYGSPAFIQKSVQAMHNIQGANGLHLYPQTSYWDWPYSADKTNPRLFQVDRDWIWYKAWARYAWQSERDNIEEQSFWNDQLDQFYGCGEYANNILIAYDEFGEIAPKLLRRFGISDGNRQTLLLGMFMSQLVNPYKWRVYQNFYSSNGPEGEILLTYAEKEWKGEKHVGETPTQIIEEVVKHGEKAVEAIDKASTHIKKNKDEFERLKNDIYCYNAFANYFAEKVKAALLVLQYKYSKNIQDLENAVPHLEKSVEYFEKLTELTKNTYLYANSMQTQQRRIPMDGTDGKNKTWEELLPYYQEELINFKRNVASLKNNDGRENRLAVIESWKPVDVIIKKTGLKRFRVSANSKIYTDKEYKITEVAPELNNLNGVMFSFEDQQKEGSVLHFSNDKPVKVVTGYFNGHSFKILPPPTLETNALANERGQADVRIANAMNIPDLYPVNIYTYDFEPGEHTLTLGKGIVMILGFIDGTQNIITRDAGIGGKENIEGIDWLFY